MTYTHNIPPHENDVHVGSEAEQWAKYNAEQTINIIWVCVGSAIFVAGLIGIAKSAVQQRTQKEKTASENRIQELEEKVKKLEAQNGAGQA